MNLKTKGDGDMRTISMMTAAALSAAALGTAQVAGAATQDGFDACDVFTQAEAKVALGGQAEPEPVNPKARKPKVVPTCTWWGSKEGKAISAAVTFRFGRTEGELQRAFDDEKLRFQTKPMLIGDATAFWSAKQGVLQLLKGRTWIVIAVGGSKPAERDGEASKRIAEALEKKL
jgi:hypothetical protein